MSDFFKLIRVHHWVKNFFLFIPGFFSGLNFKENHIYHLIIGFVAFCFVSSAVYVLNDLKDMNYDRNHPAKKTRPLAAGKISILHGLIIMIISLMLGLFLAYQLDIYFLLIVVIYFLLNVAYSFKLKKISILDILVIASGFVLRTVAGGVIVEVPLSNWLMIMIFLLAVFLALSKRFDDLIVAGKSEGLNQENIQHYNLEFISSGLTMIAGVIIVSYFMYTISEEVIARLGVEHLYFTGIFVVAGLLRYLQITLVEKNSGSPVRVLFQDKFILLTLMGWFLSFLIIIYF